MASDLPADVKLFIGQSVESLAQLEALLLLRQDRERSWSPEEFAKALYISEEMSAALLAGLARRGFASESDRCFRYHVAEQLVEQVIESLAQLYRERRVAVTTEIYSKPVSDVQTFADAFRLRREE